MNEDKKKFTLDEKLVADVVADEILTVEDDKENHQYFLLFLLFLCCLIFLVSSLILVSPSILQLFHLGYLYNLLILHFVFYFLIFVLFQTHFQSLIILAQNLE